MNEESIRNMFLRIVTEYDYLDYSEDEIIEEFADMLSMAVIELQMQGMLLDIEYDATSGFSDEPSPREGYILAYASVLIWLTPKVNSAEMLAAQLTSTDFTQFSNANRLQACIKLYAQCEAKLNNLIMDYDKMASIIELKEEL
jgi:hypothetical protein